MTKKQNLPTRSNNKRHSFTYLGTTFTTQTYYLGTTQQKTGYIYRHHTDRDKQLHGILILSIGDSAYITLLFPSPFGQLRECFAGLPLNHNLFS